jgi:SAM-dependent MidA family methyltransferase
MERAASPSPEFMAVFREHAAGNGLVRFDRFMDLALFHPSVGYYRAERPRVGRGPGTDFFTAASLGTLFGRLVADACVSLLRGADPAAHTFVEIGAEGRDRGVLAGLPHPFGGARTILAGEALSLTGRCVVFSNELFDAQPCRRFIRGGGAWRELGVREEGAALQEAEIGPAPPDLSGLLPSDALEGARFDAPLAAVALMERIAAQPWTGLLVAADYGMSFAELAGSQPSGTLRAYHRHRLVRDPLERPGEQDLTCHVCWDWLVAAVASAGFEAPTVESQESFLVRHAARALGEAVRGEAAPGSKGAILQLIHPAHMGGRFQVLHALRGEFP